VTAPVVKLEGLSTFRRTLKSAGADMEEFKDASQRTASVVVFHAMSRAPKRTGALAGSLRPARTSGSVTVYAGNNSSVVYAGPIHWGWPAHNIRAQPFLVDAAHETEPEWVGYYLSELNKIVDGIHGA
jgi:hypothetical protein